MKPSRFIWLFSLLVFVSLACSYSLELASAPIPATVQVIAPSRVPRPQIWACYWACTERDLTIAIIGIEESLDATCGVFELDGMESAHAAYGKRKICELPDHIQGEDYYPHNDIIVYDKELASLGERVCDYFRENLNSCGRAVDCDFGESGQSEEFWKELLTN